MDSKSKKKILFLIGTRPEVIKCASLILRLQKDQEYNIFVCFTGQHRELLTDTALFFNIEPDINLDLMLPDQSLSQFASKALIEVEKIFIQERPDLVVVQGDTSTVLVGAWAAYYQKIPVAHLEAGLRSFDMYNPFPEEMNRVQTSRLATYHFVPTSSAAENLAREQITKNVFLVGNTVIDALFYCVDKVGEEGEEKYISRFPNIDFEKKIILITIHRRENFGDPLNQILGAIAEFANGYPDIQIIIPVHPNPQVKKIVEEILHSLGNVLLLKPLSYPEMVFMMNKSFFILTDSGGVQEEAPSLKKPILVLRTTTERMESIQAGNAILVGHDKEKILGNMVRMIEDKEYHDSFSAHNNPYGDGNAVEKIVQILNEIF